MLKYKGYTGSVEYSDEDKCLFGKVQGLHGTLISYEGTTIEEITKDFECAVDDYLESCKERGQPSLTVVSWCLGCLPNSMDKWRQQLLL